MDKSITTTEILKKSIAAGIMIGIGATVKLCCDNQILGALLFSIGLFFICNSNMLLFTGRIGYINKKNWTEYPLIWFGNLLGCEISMGLIKLAKPELQERVKHIMETKLNMGIIPLAILSFFCGVLMFLAVNNFKPSTSENAKQYGIIFSVIVFLISGYEHSIANMAYSILYISNGFDVLKCFHVITVSTLFNAIGSIFIKKLLVKRGN